MYKHKTIEEKIEDYLSRTHHLILLGIINASGLSYEQIKECVIELYTDPELLKLPIRDRGYNGKKVKARIEAEMREIKINSILEK